MTDVKNANEADGWMGRVDGEKDFVDIPAFAVEQEPDFSAYFFRLLSDSVTARHLFEGINSIQYPEQPARGAIRTFPFDVEKRRFNVGQRPGGDFNAKYHA